VGVRLVEGGPPQAPPLVLVHGLGGGVEDFYGLAPHLAPRWRCVLADLPGFGLSDLPEAGYAPAYFAGVLEELAASLGLARPAWLGHSLGGQVVLWLAIHRPALVERAALICPAGGQRGPSLAYRLLFKFLTRGDRLRLYSPWLMRQAVALVFEELLSLKRSAACRELGTRLGRLWAGPERPARERALIRAAAALLANPVYQDAPAIQCPVLMVTGRGDRMVPPAWTDRLRLHLPHGTLHRVVPGGHMPVYLAVEELAAALGEIGRAHV
jgi:pimeloyl-ACP methyl ester carboxylesterase